MTTVPSKHHQPLHNFSLPFLKWGHTLQSNHHHCRRRYFNNHKNNRHRLLPNNITTTKTDEIDDVLLNGGNKSVDADVAVNGDLNPWNLRPRRCVMDNGDGYGAVAAVPVEEKEEQRKKKKMRLWISLSKEEIEEDIYAFTGSRPSRRPKKRNKTEQKQLDNVFPGLYLVGVSADSYRV